MIQRTLSKQNSSQSSLHFLSENNNTITLHYITLHYINTEKRSSNEILSFTEGLWVQDQFKMRLILYLYIECPGDTRERERERGTCCWGQVKVNCSLWGSLRLASLLLTVLTGLTGPATGEGGQLTPAGAPASQVDTPPGTGATPGARSQEPGARRERAPHTTGGCRGE